MYWDRVDKHEYVDPLHQTAELEEAGRLPPRRGKGFS